MNNSLLHIRILTRLKKIQINYHLNKSHSSSLHSLLNSITVHKAFLFHWHFYSHKMWLFIPFPLSLPSFFIALFISSLVIYIKKKLIKGWKKYLCWSHMTNSKSENCEEFNWLVFNKINDSRAFIIASKVLNDGTVK